MVRRIRIDQPEESRPHFSPNAFAADESEAAAALSDAGSTEEDSPTEDAGPILVVTDAFEAEHIRAVERQVQQVLLTHPDVTFSSITVSQIEGAVCLRGRLEYVRTEPEVCEIVRKIARVETVWNELVIRRKNVSSSQE